MDKIIPLVGDILIKVKNKGIFNDFLFRVALNSSFIEKKYI